MYKGLFCVTLVYMKRSRPKTRWSLIVILLVAATLTYTLFRYLYPPQPADIFLIDSASLNYGETTLTGVLNKNAPAGEEGDYLLVLPEGNVIVLDVEGVDNLLGLTISAQGFLLPPIETISPINPYMRVSSVTVN